MSRVRARAALHDAPRSHRRHARVHVARASARRRGRTSTSAATSTARPSSSTSWSRSVTTSATAKAWRTCFTRSKANKSACRSSRSPTRRRVPPPRSSSIPCARASPKIPRAATNRRRRWSSILEAALDGRIRIQCPFTAQKRLTRELSRFTDRYPVVAMLTFLTAVFGSIGAVVWAFVLTMHGH